MDNESFGSSEIYLDSKDEPLYNNILEDNRHHGNTAYNKIGYGG